MGSIQANAAREILAGVNEALGHRVPSVAIQNYIDELEEQIDTDNGPSCYCGAHNHGGDCMCFEGI